MIDASSKAPGLSSDERSANPPDTGAFFCRLSNHLQSFLSVDPTDWGLWTSVSLPIVTADNRIASVFVRKQDDVWQITDGGRANGELFCQGFEDYDEALEVLARDYGIAYVAGEFRTESSFEKLPDAVLLVGCCSASAMALRYDQEAVKRKGWRAKGA